MFSRTGLLAFPLIILLYHPASVHATEIHNWSARFGGTGTDVVTDLASTSSNGDPVYITGVFADTITFGDSSLTSAGGSDVFLARIDYNGIPGWSRRMGGASNDVAHGIAMVGGGLIVVGSFEGTANFGGDDLTSAGGRDIFIAKYGGAGVHIFSWRFGGPLDDEALGISGVNPFLVTGYFNGTVNFGGNDLTSVGGRDIFVARWHGNGTPEWSYRYGGALDDVGAAIASTTSYAVVVGSFAGTTNLGGANLISAGGSDIFYAQYDFVSGAHQQSARFGGTADDFGTEVSVRSDRFYFTGSFRETANFGGGPLASYGGSDAFLAAYNTAGVHLWSKRLGGPLDDYGDGMSDRGFLTLTGSFAGTANLGGGPRTSAGGTDAFLAKFELDDGFHIESQAFGGPLDDAGTAVAIHRSMIPEDASNNPILAGWFNGTVDVGGGPLTSAGESDVLMLDLWDFFLTGAGDAPQKGSITVACFPNPFNPRTSVLYTVPGNAPVTVAVFDPKGAHVATLVNREHRNAGDHRAEWDGRADVGGLAASGVYFVRVEQLGVSNSTKLVLLK